jgi:hypothetical protein
MNSCLFVGAFERWHMEVDFESDFSKFFFSVGKAKAKVISESRSAIKQVITKTTFVIK